MLESFDLATINDLDSKTFRTDIVTVYVTEYVRN